MTFTSYISLLMTRYKIDHHIKAVIKKGECFSQYMCTDKMENRVVLILTKWKIIELWLYQPP